MKLLAISSGSRNGNTETLVKEALMAAEQEGASVELIRVCDLDIKPCIGCRPCLKSAGGCIWKDDAAFVRDKILDADGLLVAAPVYCLTPAGVLLMIRDRVVGPDLDYAATCELLKQTDLGFEGTFDNMKPDERIMRKRVGAYIVLGGAINKDWISLGLANMYTFLLPMGTNIIDQMEVWGCADQGAAAMRDDLVARAAILGRHLAKAMQMPAEEAEYMGEEPKYACPSCHTSLVHLDAENKQVECAICGIKGNLVVSGQGIEVIYPEEEIKVSRIYDAGRAKHGREIIEVAQKFRPFKEEAEKRLKKYKDYKDCIIKPPKK